MTTWVLLRGLAREARHWGRFTELLREKLPAGDALLTPDLPGNGTRWRERSPATVPAMVDAVREQLAGAGQEPPFVLVAVSLGGMVALHWSHVAPQEVRGCVLVNSSTAGLSLPWQRLRPGSWAPLAGLLLPGVTALARERAVLRLTSNQQVPDTVARAWARYAQDAPAARANVLRQLLAAARYRPPALPPPVPVLLLASAADRLVAPACSRRMAAAWNVPLREHPWAGHDLPLDDPGWAVAQVGAWAALRVPAAVSAGACPGPRPPRHPPS